ncbi:hypothetical protein Tco_1448557 [Tanacetum coccineum]
MDLVQGNGNKHRRSFVSVVKGLYHKGVHFMMVPVITIQKIRSPSGGEVMELGNEGQVDSLRVNVVYQGQNQSDNILESFKNIVKGMVLGFVQRKIS